MFEDVREELGKRHKGRREQVKSAQRGKEIGSRNNGERMMVELLLWRRRKRPDLLLKTECGREGRQR